MVSYRMIAVAGFLASVNALPLNINLGAYSPALVVGDGEISFGGGTDVTNLMNALEGAAVDAAAGTATENAAVAAQSNNQAAQTNQEETVAAQSTESTETAEAPVTTTTASTNAAADPNLQEQAAQISTLQGMGKEIAPRSDEEASPKAKRDLAGFDRALTYAEAALTKGPTIQLGTGEEGAGVGIIVDNNAGTVGNAAAAVAKREETQPRRRTKVTRMYVKRGIPAAIQESKEFETRSVEALPVVNLPSLSKRQNADAIDQINLNVEGSEGITMTFVETTEDDGTDEADDDFDAE
ncbi:hypothetical protein F4778DRAFT_45072 [Xylariomycetidae sp. FL2044]|nr:hypothetical protein F4778DRAFT_45072 [Xylariomycetidae sp. FL2044]